jgi:asparagine synthase (glutamine-hydrolysing)
MSVQFGKWNFSGEPSAPDDLERVHRTFLPYGPDGGNTYSGGGASILYRAFHTTKESRSETQPLVLSCGAVLTWDGRLDNRAELLNLLDGGLLNAATDVSIVAAAYQRSGVDCFRRLIGDWALSLWNPIERSLVLAKDPIGARHLYYSVASDHLAWSSLLEPLVLFAERELVLDEEYIAGWLASFPDAQLTPYLAIRSVPPSCYVRLEPGRRSIRRYWDFDPSKRIRYTTDGEYEEQFRTLFMQAVRRRLRSDSTILAELSGGMDSSSIVCVADTITAQGAADTLQIDTLSYYDDSEPHWNERPYFESVERQRGRAGFHIDVGGQQSFAAPPEGDSFAATPGSVRGRPTRASRQFSICLASQGSRVLLSGVGGDEVMGGVPAPALELMDLLATARFATLARQLKAWALNKRKPWFHLLFEATHGFLPAALVGLPKYPRPAPWLDPGFVERHRVALTGYRSRVKFFGPPPAFQANVSALNMLRRQLACSAPSRNPPYEKRYPYLDRDLLEFMYAIPREQVLRPGQRRFLMRRALAGIVPDEIVNRKRKAFVVRSPVAAIANEWEVLDRLSQQMVSASLGIVNARAFREALEQARQGKEVPMIPLLRTLGLEVWLRALSRRQGCADSSASKMSANAPILDAEPVPALRHTGRKHSVG